MDLYQKLFPSTNMFIIGLVNHEIGIKMSEFCANESLSVKWNNVYLSVNMFVADIFRQFNDEIPVKFDIDTYQLLVL